MWLFYGVIGMIGSTMWYLLPKIFPNQNPIATIFWGSAITVILCPILLRIFDQKWVIPSALPSGAFLGVSLLLATGGFMMAINTGGKLSVVSIIIEISLILTALAGIWIFKESLSWQQILGIVLAILGVVLVVGFEKQ